MVTLATSKILSRSKSAFKSARAAWESIGRATGLEPRDVRSAGHTATAWRWIKKGVKRSRNVAKKRKQARKKPRSAKQRANDARLGRMAKARGRKSAPKRRKAPKRKTRRRSAPKRVNKPKKRSKSVVGTGSIKKVINNPILKKVLLAAGAVSVATTVVGLVAPQFVSTIQRPIVRAGLGFVTGDFVGAISNFVIGGGGGLTGGSGAGVAAAQGSNGFA